MMTHDATEPAIFDHLFRREAGRLVSGLTRLFGVRHLTLAQDVVQDVFCRALEVWKFKGVPDNPSAWLAAAARHRAIDVLRREQLMQRAVPDVADIYVSQWGHGDAAQGPAFDAEIRDDELRMMFSCCHPELSEQAQVGLILHILCGFSVSEIAAAFLENEAAVGKRLQRARRALAQPGKLFDIAGIEPIRERLNAVHRALYLLFSEGYHGSHPEQTIREDLCEEAARLCTLLAEHHATATPATFALLGLMCLGAARLPARQNELGELCNLTSQDRSRWNRALIDRGLALLAESAAGDHVSVYHLEAAIAAEHAMAPRAEDTDWPKIAEFYEALAALTPGPVVLLNRAIAVGMAQGPEAGLTALVELRGRKQLTNYPFYDAAMGEFSLRAGRRHARTSNGRSRQHVDLRNDAFSSGGWRRHKGGEKKRLGGVRKGREEESERGARKGA